LKDILIERQESDTKLKRLNDKETTATKENQALKRELNELRSKTATRTSLMAEFECTCTCTYVHMYRVLSNYRTSLNYMATTTFPHEKVYKFILFWYVVGLRMT